MAKLSKSTISLVSALSVLLSYYIITGIPPNLSHLRLMPQVYLVVEPADFIYNNATLHGIKQRVESNQRN